MLIPVFDDNKVFKIMNFGDENVSRSNFVSNNRHQHRKIPMTFDISCEFSLNMKIRKISEPYSTKKSPRFFRIGGVDLSVFIINNP